MKTIYSLFFVFTLFLFLSLPVIVSADCDMMALISIQNNTIGTLIHGEGLFDDPHDFFDFLRSRSGPSDTDIPLNSDGYGVLYYKMGSTLVAEEEEFYKSGLGIWYTPDNNDPMDLAENAVMNPDNQATIVLGHDRLGTGGEGSHPFIFKWNGNTYTFIHNGIVSWAAKDAFMNFLGEDWFLEHPSNWFGVYGNLGSFIDSELFFHFIMSRVIENDGNVEAGIIEALNCTDVMGVNFRSMVFSAQTTMNFVLSDGIALYVFRNSRYAEALHNLSYNVIDSKFIGIKTQGSLDNIIQRNQLVIFDQAGNITANILDVTLPIELAYFNGTVSLEGIVTMNWQTASETGMTGFNIYRGDSELFADAVKLNPELISASNNANGSNYQFLDEETMSGYIYHYWLECIDTSGTVANTAQITITIPNHNDPNVPPASTTYLLPNYPNPFQSSSRTSIPLHLRSGDSGTLSIFNIKGQKITDFHVSSGNHTLIWDGHNSQGEPCVPGVYLTHLKTKDMSKSRKLLMIK
jgi:hypothetical protein